MTKLFGNDGDASPKIAEVTQGIGFEQLGVEGIPDPAPPVDPIVVTDDLGLFESFSTQDPTGGGDAGKIIVNYGTGGSTINGEFTVNPDGTCITNPPSNGEQYQFRIVFRIGRTGASGNSVPIIRFMYSADGIAANAVQVGSSASVLIDDDDTVWREVFDINFAPEVGSVFFVEFARDEAGSNSGSIMAPQPTGTLSSWNSVPTSRMLIRKAIVV